MHRHHLSSSSSFPRATYVSLKVETIIQMTDGPSLPLSLSLPRSNALLNPNSELFSPAGIKKRHRARADERIKLNFTLDRPRPTIHNRVARVSVQGIFVNLGSIRKDAPRQISSTPFDTDFPALRETNGNEQKLSL